ncbi:MAG: hypothetical protein H6925_02850 [Holosporaceae bacterium]|nr:MAG: hypothetical protein H6925_02850 [Holosporaceae bacterium]
MPQSKPAPAPLRPLPVKLVPIGMLTQSPKKTAHQKTKIKKQPERVPLKKSSTSTPEKEKAVPLPEKKVQSSSDQTKESPKKQQDHFEDVLKTVETLAEEKGKPKKDSFDSDLISDKISLSELDALRQQIQGCWLVPPGVLAERDLMIEVGIHLDAQAHIQKIKILNGAPSRKSAVFKVAVQSIRQALKAPECTPLRVPLDKYASWKYCVLRFSPRGIG